MASISSEIFVPPPSEGLRTDISEYDAFPRFAGDLQNFVFRNGRLRTRPSLTSVGQTASGDDPLTFFRFREAGGTLRHLSGGTLNVYRWIGSWSVLGGGPLTGTYRDRPVFRIFDVAGAKLVIFTNGADPVKSWDPAGGTTYANLGGSPPRARCMVVSGDHVVLLNLKSGGVISGAGYDCSAALSPTTGWGGTTQRGILQGTNGEIVAALEMGSLLTAVYTEDGIHLMQFQGGAEPFRFELKALGISGPANTGAVVPLPDGSHAYLGRDFMPYVFDGVFPRPLGAHVQKFLMEQVNPHTDGILDTSFLAFDPRNALLWIFYPLGPASVGDYPNRAVALDLNSGAMWPMRFDHAEARRLSGGGAFNPLGTSGNIELLLGDSNAGWTSTLDSSATSGQDTVNAVSTQVSQFVETGIFDGGKKRTFKTVQEIEHFFRTASGSVTPVLISKNYGEVRITASLTPHVLDGGPYVSGIGRGSDAERAAHAFGLRLAPGASSYLEWEGSAASVVLRGER